MSFDLLKSEILKEFIMWNPTLVSQMRECNHSNGINLPNPYHIEDSVWSHTMMVLKLIKTNKDQLMNIARIIVALCHDIGKVRTRVVKEENGHVSFFNHEYASVQPTIDFIHHLHNTGFFSRSFCVECVKNDFVFRDILIDYCVVAVSNHLEAFKRSLGFESFIKFTNNSVDTANLLVDLMDADCNGRFCFEKDQDNSESKLREFNTFTQIYRKIHSDGKEPIYIMGGVAGCGKDYIAKNMIKDERGFVILSFDNIRLQLFKENNTIYGGMSPTDIYNQAFRWSCDKNVDFSPILRKQINESLSKGKVVFISNTNCTRKSRKSLLNSISNGLRKNYCFEMIYVISDLNTIMKRNRERVNDKVLNDEVVLKFAYNQQIPNMLENFDDVVIISN